MVRSAMPLGLCRGWVGGGGSPWVGQSGWGGRYVSVRQDGTHWVKFDRIDGSESTDPCGERTHLARDVVDHAQAVPVQLFFGGSRVCGVVYR